MLEDMFGGNTRKILNGLQKPTWESSKSPDCQACRQQIQQETLKGKFFIEQKTGDAYMDGVRFYPETAIKSAVEIGKQEEREHLVRDIQQWNLLKPATSDMRGVYLSEVEWEKLKQKWGIK